MDLSELSVLVKTNKPFDATNYPKLAGADADTILSFAASHIQKHVVQTVGSLAVECEESDHSGKPPSKPALLIAARRLMVHAICLANVAGLTPEELEEALVGWANSN
jgi:hypothetical protein